MRIWVFAAAAFLSLGPQCAARAATSDGFLRPAVRAGDRFAFVFSKTISISGADFDAYTGRISGSSIETIASVTPQAITEQESYRYDGRPAGVDQVVVRDHGATNCVDGKCAPNDQTSAPLFNPLLWGAIPPDLTKTSTWRATIPNAWEIGPAGEETVRVVLLDPADGLVTLERRGHGSGPSSDDAARSQIKIVSKGKTLMVKLVPGDASWEGYASVRHGVTVSDEIIVHRPVTLTAATGETFQAEERVYTLFIQAPVAG
ncbi:hypothetical protein [Phenylobacterium sp.]|jgi:hypothetical protein|uniref:hypothetical protein n=1 Tax=Phenylobacterium sp. TaxID=1871053 RepID=UPI002F4292D8